MILITGALYGIGETLAQVSRRFAPIYDEARWVTH